MLSTVLFTNKINLPPYWCTTVWLCQCRGARRHSGLRQRVPDEVLLGHHTPGGVNGGPAVRVNGHILQVGRQQKQSHGMKVKQVSKNATCGHKQEHGSKQYKGKVGAASWVIILLHLWLYAHATDGVLRHFEAQLPRATKQNRENIPRGSVKECFA
jgi:hypothetical protein